MSSSVISCPIRLCWCVCVCWEEREDILWRIQRDARTNLCCCSFKVLAQFDCDTLRNTANVTKVKANTFSSQLAMALVRCDRIKSFLQQCHFSSSGHCAPDVSTPQHPSMNVMPWYQLHQFECWVSKRCLCFVASVPKWKPVIHPPCSIPYCSAPQYLHDKVILWLRHGHSQVGKWSLLSQWPRQLEKRPGTGGECSNGSSHCCLGSRRLETWMTVWVFVICLIYEAGKVAQKAAGIRDPIGMSVIIIYVISMYNICMLCSFKCSI